MNTPIVDFVKDYIARDAVRGHMPGHKGVPRLGCEPLDITEFDGADSLYEAGGIIAASEKNASALFGCTTMYSTEGSSHAIRAMLYLMRMYAAACGKTPTVLAGRNAHSVFVSAAAMLGVRVTWLPCGTSYLMCNVDPALLEQAIVRERPTAVYLTSPDYLGNTVDIAALSAACRRHGVLLLIDNAHGAYLRFLPTSRHPMDLGADMCCDSAHKTLPVLTGGAYLHIGRQAPSLFAAQAKRALALFGSTSPSYVILQSLDLANAYLADGYAQRLRVCAMRVAALKEVLTAHGYTVIGDEPLKITIATKSYGYRGETLAAALCEQGVVCEFYDPDVLVLMVTPESGDLHRLQTALTAIPPRSPISETPPSPHVCEAAMDATAALFCESETVEVQAAVGRVLCAPTVGCPPAVPIVMCGERIDREALACFAYYGITHCCVVKE